MPVDQKLVNCDMCVLAYQNYHQAVIWPLDPWYEVLARGGSNRRTLFMMAVHKLAGTLPARDATAAYAGPGLLGALGPSNVSLDPILTNYPQINPKLPAFTGDGSVFLALQTPRYLTQNLRYVKVVTYSEGLRAAVAALHDYGEGQDEMVVFEGGTGIVNQGSGAWSPMGFVMKRHAERGEAWDAHIVFRGSRSGSAGRAAKQGMKGFSGPTGNPDWVTDMASAAVTLPQEVHFAAAGAANGFVNALRACFPAILAALEEVAKNRPPPSNIYVAGHSLGAALASMFCCAVALNGADSHASSPGKVLRATASAALRAWPWDNVKGWFYALPPTGTKAFCDAYLAAIKGKGQANAPYCDGDLVVECSNSIGTMDTGFSGKVGWVAGSGGYSAGALEKLPKPASAASGENPHELYLIRAAILTKLGRLAVPEDARDAQPWGVYPTFRKMLNGEATNFAKTSPPPIALVTRENLRQLLSNYHFARHFDLLLKMLADIVKHKDSYRGVHYTETLNQLAENVQLAASLELAAADGPVSKESIVDRVGTQVSILCAFSAARTEWFSDKAKPEKDGSVTLQAEETLGKDFDTRIGLGMLLRALELHGTTTLADYEKLEVLRWCLDVKLS